MALIGSCSLTDAEPPASRGPATPVATDGTALPRATLSARAVFVDGFVERGRGGSWLPLEIGDSIEAEDSVRTGPDGVCDIQFGAKATLRVQSSTLYVMNEINLGGESSRVDASLAIGTVLSKVNKLADKDSYMIRTETSVAGVRGTDFSVSADSVRGTTVAVSKGEVAVLPVSPAVYRLLDQAAANPAAALAVGAIVQGAAVVSADHSLTVSAQAAAQAAEVHDQIEAFVASLDAEAVAAVAAVIGPPAAPAAAAAEAGSPAPASAAPASFFAGEPLLAAGLSAFERLGAAPPAAGPRALAAPPPSAAAEVVTAIRAKAQEGLPPPTPGAIPERSPLRDSLRVIESMPAASPAPEPLSLLPAAPTQDAPAAAPAAETATPAAVATPIPAPPARPAAAPTPPARPAPAASPAARPPAPTVPRTTPAPQSAPRPTTAPAPQAPAAPAAAAAAARPEPAKASPIVSAIRAQRAAVGGSVVRVPDAGVFVLTDPRGGLTGLSADGQVLWSLETANRGADAMSAVPYKGVAYFSGSNEFLAVDARSGEVLFRRALDGERSHVLGNRTAPFADFIAFPTMVGVELVDPRTGELKRTLPIPGGTTMSPANYGGLVAIVNQRGVFMLIDPETGELRGQIQTGAQQPVALAPRILGDRACFADRKGLLVMVDLSSMSVAWERPLPAGVFNDLEFSEDAVVALSRGAAYVFSPDGAELLKPIQNVTAPPLLSRGVLYYGTADRSFVATRLSDGEELGRLGLDARLSARPLAAEGFIYLGLADGSFVKLDASRLAE